MDAQSPNPRAVREHRRERRLDALRRVSRTVPISFAIVGVQKAATTSLYRMLAEHPEVAAWPQKELRFFLKDSQGAEPDYSEYARPARHPAQHVAGDATPAYFVWPRALERMRDYNPDLQLILCLRDPVERAFSQWSMERMRNPSFPALPAAIEQFAGEPLRTDLPEGVGPGAFSKRTMFVRGMYGAQLERGLGLFPREQWLVIDFRDIVANHRTTLDRTAAFLGIEAFSTYPELPHQNRSPTDHAGPGPSVGQVEQLVELYRDDLAKLSSLSGLEVGHWPTSRVLSGQLRVQDFADSLTSKLGLSVGTA